MEHRVGNSHGAEAPRKSRSLDLKSLYESKSSIETQNKKLKRKGGVGGSSSERGQERKKSRKALSISSFKNVNRNASRSLEEVYSGSRSPVSRDSKDSKLVGSSGRSADSRGHTSISLSLEDSVAKVPRRKRGFVGRRKVESGSRMSKPLEESGDRVDSVDRAGELAGIDLARGAESSQVERRTGGDDFGENRKGASSSGRHLEEDDGQAGHSILNNGDSVPRRSRPGQSVENDGDSSSKKSLRKWSRKRKHLAPESRNATKEFEPSMDASVRISDTSQDDDEENLEENAAMMLSLRFDPSCTGFSSNNKPSSSRSMNGRSFFSSPGQQVVAHGSNYVSGSESASVDTAGRVLRPRQQHEEKGGSRKRRHYYEVSSGDLDGHWVLNRRIKVFWPLDKSWYYGIVSGYDDEKRLHHVKYDDRDEEWIDLRNERFKLLLLPSEVPAKTQRKRSATRKKHSEGDEGKFKPHKEEKRELIAEADGCEGNSMDSEPIIAWLARPTRRVKSSPLHGLKKQKTSALSLTSGPLLLSEEPVHIRVHVDGESLNGDGSKFSGNSALVDSSASAGRTEVSAMEGSTCPGESKLPVVYYRRRFRKPSHVLCHRSEVNHAFTNLPESDTSPAPVVAASGVLGERDVSLGATDCDKALGRLDTVEALWLTNDAGLLRLNTLLSESRQFRLELSLPVPPVLNYSFGAEHVWLIRAVILLQHGMLMAMSPRVHLEMLFVDNIVGLRFLLFEGCLKQAVALVFLVLTVFCQPNDEGKYADLHLPVTSIRFKFSCIQDCKKQLMFAFYNFSEMENSKWMYLDFKLKRHCLLMRQLPLSECTYDNVKALQNGTGQLLSSSICGVSTLMKGPRRRCRQFISLMGVSRESTCVNASQSSFSSDKNNRSFPPFALSFSAAPTFFLGLHLKLLMERSVAHISFWDCDSTEHLEGSNNLLANDCSCVVDCSRKGSESTSDDNSSALLRHTDCDGCLSCAKSVPQTSVCSVGDRRNSSPKQRNDGVDVETSTSSKDPPKLGSEDQQCHHSGTEQCDISSRLSVDSLKSDNVPHSLLNGITVEIPSVNLFEKHADKALIGAQQSADLSCSMNGGIIPSPNPTARRSTWNRSRSSSTSFGFLSHGWSDGMADFIQNNFGNRPKKPRTQVSYALPSGGFDHGTRNKSHQQRGLPHKRIRTNERRLADASKDSERDFDSLSCDANLLVTLGDRGRREFGAQIVLELFDGNEWRLAVKLSGRTKYSYKAVQFLQLGSTNRFTHAMMWKGGKDWTLEFFDRSQWVLFKELHEECYDRNVRAAAAKTIPVPEVRLMEENSINGIEVPSVRSSSKYFRQNETDVEMALNPSRVLYDMDSDDEQWVRNQISFEVNHGCLWGISEDMFEKTMDLLEKVAYSQQRDQFSTDEIDELMAGVAPKEAIKTIHDYWQQKRWRKGMPLIRHLQPPLWERYQQQVREWELAITKNNTALPNGCHEKVVPIEKPPMFAFCLKPRGLEVPNKGSKQRSQRRFSIGGQSNTLSGDHNGIHTSGRRLNGFASGDEKFLVPGHSHEPLNHSPLPQISPRVFSPRDAGSTGYFPVSGDRYDRKQMPKLHRSNSKKSGALVSPRDTQMLASNNQRILDKRNGIHRQNVGFSDWPSQRHYSLDGDMRYGPDQLDGSDLDEFRLRDASSAAQHALNMAKLKREKAQRLLYRADLAIHKAVVALMTAEAIKGSTEDFNGDG